MRKLTQKGFTITELVIVIAVIAILAAVLLPTFSQVTDKAKESADTQLLKEINVALYNEQVSNIGEKPRDYKELMNVLNRAGFCDGANMYLIASTIMQEDKYLFWREETNDVVLLDGIKAQFFQANGSAPNYYNNRSGSGDGKGVSEFGYILSTATSGDKGGFANWYLGKYGAAQIEDPVFSVVIMNYEKQLAAGLTTATARTNWYNEETIKEGGMTEVIIPKGKTASGAEVNLALENYGSVSELQTAAGEANKEAAKEAATYLAGIVSLVNNGINMAGMELNVVPVEAVVDEAGNVTYQAGTIDLDEVAWTPIGDQPRKTASPSGVFQGNLDLGYTDAAGNTTATTIANLVTDNTYIVNNAEMQTLSDAGLSEDGYMFNYGLFAFVYSGTDGKDASSGMFRSAPISIKNITFVDCAYDLTNNSVEQSGKSYKCFTDCAGIVVGCAYGDVVFENINIGTPDKKVSIAGFDGVGALVGRHYGATSSKVTQFNADLKNLADTTIHYGDGKSAVVKGNSLIAYNCNIYAEITGDRRSGGIAGFTSSISQVIFDHVTTDITSIQQMKNTTGDAIESCILGVFQNVTINLIDCNINGTTQFVDIHKSKGGDPLDASTFTLSNTANAGGIDHVLVGRFTNGTETNLGNTFKITNSTICGTEIASFDGKAADLNAVLNPAD